MQSCAEYRHKAELSNWRAEGEAPVAGVDDLVVLEVELEAGDQRHAQVLAVELATHEGRAQLARGQRTVVEAQVVKIDVGDVPDSQIRRLAGAKTIRHPRRQRARDGAVDQ